MSDFSALWYFESRRIVNFVRKAVKEPARLIVWILFIAWFGFSAWERYVASGHALAARMNEPTASIIGFSVIGVLALLAMQGARGRVGTFSDTADARFLNASHLDERFVVLWLQLRSAFATVARLSVGIILYVVLFARANAAGAAIALIGFVALTSIIALPAFILGRRIGTRVVTILCVIAAGLAACAAILPALSFAFPLPAWLTNALIHLGVGHAVIQLWGGLWIWLATLWLGIALLVAVAVAASHDLYPELYTATQIWAARWSRARGGINFNRPKRGVERAESRSTPLRGVAISIWKEQLTYLRSPGARTMFFIELGIALVGGAIAGFIGRHNPGTMWTILIAAFGTIILLLAISGTSLAHDLSKPIWWLGVGSTFSKLAAWTFATSLDSMLVLILGILAVSIAAGIPLLAIAGVSLALLIPFLVRAIGVVTYAFLPGAIDRRGPVAMLRMLAIYLCFAPPITIGVIVSIVTQQGALGITAGALVGILEGLFAVVIASWRIEGRGAEYGVAERT